MIADEYKQPSFDSARNLNTPLGIKDSGDWSQDGQSLFIDQVCLVFQALFDVFLSCLAEKKMVFMLRLEQMMENIIQIRCFLKFIDIGKEFCQGMKIDHLNT